jgi:hypothetical protein
LRDNYKRFGVQPRQRKRDQCQLLEALPDSEGRAAVQIVSKTTTSQILDLEKTNAKQALRETQRQLRAEIAAIEQLQKISTQLISADNAEVLYQKLIDAATDIMRSDFASMQMFYPERGELRLLAHRGFNPIAATSFRSARRSWSSMSASCVGAIPHPRPRSHRGSLLTTNVRDAGRVKPPQPGRR